MVGIKWTPLLVADRLREAGETLKLLLLKHPGRSFTSSWPAFVSEAGQYMDYGDTRVSPSTKAIDRMDEVIMEWLGILDREEVQVIWSWVCSVPARMVAHRMGIHRATLHRRRIGALEKISIMLNAKGLPIGKRNNTDYINYDNQLCRIF
jgi:hypothetical protein